MEPSLARQFRYRFYYPMKSKILQHQVNLKYKSIENKSIKSGVHIIVLIVYVKLTYQISATNTFLWIENNKFFDCEFLWHKIYFLLLCEGGNFGVLDIQSFLSELLFWKCIWVIKCLEVSSCIEVETTSCSLSNLIKIVKKCNIFLLFYYCS